MSLLIIVPTYNEKENLSLFLKEALQLGLETLDILVVDDNSTDGTAELALTYPSAQVHLLSRPYKQGLGLAYLEAFRWAIARRYDYVIQMDVDGSHPLSYVPDLLKNLSQHNLVMGSRLVFGGLMPGIPWYRKLLTKVASYYVRWYLDIPFYDVTGGFNAWRTSLLQYLLDDIRSKGFIFQVELKYKAFLKKAKIIEIPIAFLPRKHGTSKMSFKILLEAFYRVLEFRFRKF